ncbi:MAG: NAD(P)H-hydrate dehydratase, partial [Burkholderiales bacterium]
GSGKVILGPLDSSFTKDYLYPELIVKKIKHLIKHIDQYSAIVVGPGLGLGKKAVKLLAKLIEQAPSGKLIFDADALNILALNPELQQKFMQLPVKVITPHPGEAARLLATTVEVVQHNRFAAVTQLSQRYNAIVLLKGAGSLIHDTASIFINQTGNPALASGGQGDTLCGLIVACAGQGMELAEALKFAVYLHGLAADELVATTLHGYNGILASEVALSCRKLLNNILYPH